MKNIAILTSWNLLHVDGQYHIGGTHFTYLQYASAQFHKVYLITSVREAGDTLGQLCISSLTNIEVIPLPAVDSYAGACKNYFYYGRAISSIKDKVDFIYCRVPDPFCWLPVLRFKMPAVMHYVGDTVDATWHNEKWPLWKKLIMIGGYLPDLALTYMASRKSKVCTNGIHLRDKLARHNIKAQAVISSTVSESELKFPEPFRTTNNPRLIYIGYLRFAKGMNLLKNLWIRLKKQNPNFIFDLVGNGEMMDDIKSFITEKGLTDNVIVHGRIDSRDRIRELLRQADLFVFPSLSEGSPRVVIEAMAEGVPVISTPVGSLPGTFTDGYAIRYFDYNDDEKAFQLISDYATSSYDYESQRALAFNMIQENFTKEKFLAQIYSL